MEERGREVYVFWRRGRLDFGLVVMEACELAAGEAVRGRLDLEMESLHLLMLIIDVQCLNRTIHFSLSILDILNIHHSNNHQLLYGLEARMRY